MNALTPVAYHAQLPDFLRDPALFAASSAAIAGIGGGSPPMISIRASKFRLVAADGEEAMVNQLTLDVIVLEGNEHVSKVYYQEAYNPADGDAKPPTCFSDNGVAPSSEAGTPQAPTCAQCPHAAWGSKVTPSGSKVKACSDSKKLAVVLAADTPVVINGAASTAAAYSQVYLLRVPAASMGNWRGYGKGILQRGIPLQGVVTRISFDPATDYPALLFAPVGFVQSAEIFASLRAKAGTVEVKDIVGGNDRPLTAAATSVAVLPAPPAHLTPTPAVVAVPPSPPLVLAATSQPAASSAAPAEAAPTVTRRRGRPAAAAVALAAATPAGPVPPKTLASPFPALAPTAPAAVAGNGAIIAHPPATDASLDALLAKALA